MANNIAIKWAVFGQFVPDANARAVHLELASERISVSDLIRRAVTAQINDLVERQRAEVNVIQLTLARHYLTPKELASQTSAGQINVQPARQRGETETRINVEEEIGKALRGFEAQAFRVVADGATFDALDDEFVLKQNTKVTFLRLMPLAGG